MNDLVSYNRKHNEADGEENCDGSDDNLSWNCGVEGPTDDRAVESLRTRQVKNFFAELTCELGAPLYERIDAPATAEEKAVLLELSPGDVSASELADYPIEAVLTTAPGNGAPIGSPLKVGLRCVHPARRTSTSSTPRAFAGATICGASSRKRKLSPGRRWPQSWDEPSRRAKRATVIRVTDLRSCEQTCVARH
jgi:hypothetical protein